MVLLSIKSKSLVICFSSYFIVLIICLLIFPIIDTGTPILNAALLDLIATALIFVISYSFNNSSFYDPYWSLAPIPILFYWTVSSGQEGFSLRQIIILSIVLIWGIRLTINSVRRWKGSKDEDWRYANFRHSFPRSYWMVSFFGIHLMPTVIVFLACLSVYPALTQKYNSIGVIDIVAVTITLTAIFIETISDEQLRKFLIQPTGQSFLSSGLWKYSRHPNYFGEVLFWIGLFFFSIRIEPISWWILPGPLAMLLLFQFISVPMIERRMLKRKEGYDRYIKKTSAWIIWFPRKESRVTD